MVNILILYNVLQIYIYILCSLSSGRPGGESGKSLALTAGIPSSRLGHSMWISRWTKRDLGMCFLGLHPISPTTNFIPPFLHTHLINFVSFQFISPCDGATGVIGRHPCYSLTFNIGTSSHRSLDPALYRARVEEIWIRMHVLRLFFFSRSDRRDIKTTVKIRCILFGTFSHNLSATSLHRRHSDVDIFRSVVPTFQYPRHRIQSPVLSANSLHWSAAHCAKMLCSYDRFILGKRWKSQGAKFGRMVVGDQTVPI